MQSELTFFVVRKKFPNHVVELFALLSSLIRLFWGLRFTLKVVYVISLQELSEITALIGHNVGRLVSLSQINFIQEVWCCQCIYFVNIVVVKLLQQHCKSQCQSVQALMLLIRLCMYVVVMFKVTDDLQSWWFVCRMKYSLISRVHTQVSNRIST